MKVLINGKIKDIKKTSIDTGYFYGYGVFETILVHKGEAVFAKEHVNRLNKSVKKIEHQTKCNNPRSRTCCGCLETL